MNITYEDSKANKEINQYIKMENEMLGVLGYTDHSKKHAVIVAERAAEMLRVLGYSKREIELCKIAGFMHDIGNCVNRSDHAHSGAIMAIQILRSMEMSAADISVVISAIGNHDEKTGTAVNAVSAAIILADKTDVRRNRVRNKKKSSFDIHDRVNYGVLSTELKANPEKKEIEYKEELGALVIPKCKTKELQRVAKEALNALDGKDVLLVFPAESKRNKTVQVLKAPKTDSSVRKIFLPKSVAEMLIAWKQEQEEIKTILGDEYMDYNLVMASTYGLPVSGSVLRNSMKKLIEEQNLPSVVFHSLRHSSVTYKLKLNGGDIKAVQGDSGHAQVNMVTDVYSHILDDDRRKNAELFEEAFYEKKELNPQMHSDPQTNTLKIPEGVDAEMLAKVLANPEMTALLTSLAKTMKG